MLTAIAILSLCVFTSMVWGAVPREGYYSTRYDHINVNTILTSKRLVMNYADCLLNKKPCPPEGKELKRVLPEALRTSCSRCTEKQKSSAFSVIRRLRKDFPDIWEELLAVWDPTGEYIRRFEDDYSKENKIQQRSPEENTLETRFGDSVNSIPSSSGGESSQAAESIPASSSAASATTAAVTASPSTASSSTASPSTAAPQQAPPAPGPTTITGVQINWIDRLGSKVFKTAGRIADMVVSTVEVVVNAGMKLQKRHSNNK